MSLFPIPSDGSLILPNTPYGQPSSPVNLSFVDLDTFQLSLSQNDPTSLALFMQSDQQQPQLTAEHGTKRKADVPSSAAAVSPDTVQKPEKKKRGERRTEVSCVRCATHKKKCDGKRPCGGCVKKDAGSSCVNVQWKPMGRPKGTPNRKTNESAPVDTLEPPPSDDAKAAAVPVAAAAAASSVVVPSSVSAAVAASVITEDKHRVDPTWDLPVAIIRYTPLSVVFMNVAARQLTGYITPELMGRSFVPSLCDLKSDLSALVAFEQSVLNIHTDRIECATSIRLIHKSGVLIPVRMQACMTRDPSVMVCGVFMPMS